MLLKMQQTAWCQIKLIIFYTQHIFQITKLQMTETVRERYNYYTVTKLEKYNKKYKFTRDMEIKKIPA